MFLYTIDLYFSYSIFIRNSVLGMFPLLDLMYLGVPLSGLVLGGTRCRYQRGVHHGAGLEQKAVGRQLGDDDFQNLWARIVFFEQVAEPQDADPVMNTLGATDACKVTLETSLEQSFFGAQVRQAKPLLQAVNAQHHCQIKRWASRLSHRCMWRNQRQQFSSRHAYSISSSRTCLRLCWVLRPRPRSFCFLPESSAICVHQSRAWRNSFEHHP